MRLDVDVAVVGSGFAGSLIAAIARRLSRSVALLERGTHPRFAIGESSTPLANLVLEDLAERYGLPRLAPLTSYGAWRRAYPELVCGLKRGFSFLSHRPGEPFGADPGRRDQLLVGASPSDDVADTHWLRSDVDAFFLSEAVARGVTYLDRVTLDTATPDPAGMTLSGTRAGARAEVRARLVVDASGPRGFLSRALGLPESAFPGMPLTEALFTHVEGARRLDRMGLFPWGDDPPYPVDDAALHHVFRGGWIWVLRFGNGVTSVGVVATRPLAERLRLAEGAPAWERLLDELPTVAAQLRGARPVRPFQHLPRVPFRSNVVAGPAWALLPSAAAFVDPLLSTGFALTLLGVERIARAIEEDWGTPRLEARLAAHGRATLLEADATAGLMSALHATFTRFDVFSGLSLLYFAAASWSETVRRLGRDPGAFLLADHRGFGPALARLCGRAARGEHEGLAGEIARAIEPFDVAGLGDPSRRSWYPADPRDLLRAAGKVGATRDEVGRMLAASGIAVA